MITIQFRNENDMKRFVKFYSGTSVNYHSNYDGQVRTDRILGGWTPLVYLERKHVKDFRKLGEDIVMFNGIIRE